MTANVYLEQREATDLDLVADVRQALQEAGLGTLLTEGFDKNPYIQEATTRRPEAQRYLLNRYWNIQLMSAKDISIEERYCLIPNGTIEDWLRLFKAKIIPFAVKNRLPVVV